MSEDATDHAFNRSLGERGVIATVLLAVLMVAPMAVTQENEASGEEEIPPQTIDAVVSCVICHGTKGEGKKALGAPRIGGLSDWYLARQLEYFRQSTRGTSEDDVYGTQMRAMALALEDMNELEAMAHYFSTLSPSPAPETISADADAERGKELYAVCAACHGQDAGGNEALNAPSLRGQHDWYLIRQLENYQNGLRGTNSADEFGAQMVPIVKSLDGENDFIDIVAYINSLD